MHLIANINTLLAQVAQAAGMIGGSTAVREMRRNTTDGKGFRQVTWVKLTLTTFRWPLII